MLNFWTALAAVAATLSAVIAAIYTWLTFRLVTAHAEPKVVVYACADPDRPTIIMLRIANIGRDVASDVQFKASRPIPARAYGRDSTAAPTANVMQDGPLVNGIPVLGPGDTRDITWGQYGGLMASVGTEPIDVTFEPYRLSRRPHFLGGWGLWDVQVGFRRRCVSAPSGW